MKLIPWRISHFFNKHFHKAWMIIKYGKIDLNTRQYWDNRFSGGGYHESESTNNVFNTMIDLIPRRAKVLDVGCGTGYFAKCLKEDKTEDVYVLDISSVTIENLRQHGINGVCSKLPKIPYDDESFDYVTAKALLEHLRTTQDSIKAMVRVLKRGGKLLVSVPNNILGPESEPEHFRKYNKETLNEELRKHLFVEEIREIDNSLLAICRK